MATLELAPGYFWTAGTMLPVVCSGVVAARFWTRSKQRLKFGIDDWLTLPALALILGCAATLLVGVAEESFGHPSPPVPPDKILTANPRRQMIARKCYWILSLLQTLCLGFIKLSCMCFYRRVFRTASRGPVDILTHIYNALVVIWTLGFFFSLLFSCGTHPEKTWGSTMAISTCLIDFPKVDLGMSISDVIMDVMLLVFPIPLIARLQMSNGRKFALIGIFILGSLAVAMSATRLEIMVQSLNAVFTAHADQDAVSGDALYFMFLEACFGLCAICLPSLSQVLKLKALETLIDGFSSILSNLSRGSRGSNHGSSTTARTRGRAGSSHSQLTPTRSAEVYTTDLEGHVEPVPPIELENLPPHKQILITNSFGHISVHK